MRQLYAGILGLEAKGHSVAQIEIGVRKYYDEHGTTPSPKEGARATRYLGYQGTWTAVNQWLRTRGHGTLSAFCRERLGLVSRMVFVTHDFKLIEKGIRKYCEKHGKPPQLNSEDATFYVGYETTWVNVNAWLRNHGQGSLSKFGRSLLSPHSLKTTKRAVRKFFKRNERPPLKGSGNATVYAGYKTTWLHLNRWCFEYGHHSLAALCDSLGCKAVATAPVVFDLNAIEEGVRKYYNEHGKTPLSKDRDTLPYVGYETTWGAVGRWLSKHGHGSLSVFSNRLLGLGPTAHSLEAIEKGIQKYYDEHGKPPSQVGDATPYVGYEANWNMVNRWLQREGHGTFIKFKESLGFGRYGAAHSLEAIEKGIRKFYEEHGKPPPARKGGSQENATPYVGYPTTWDRVSYWLGKQGHGSLSNFSKGLGFEHQPPHSVEKIQRGILKYYDEHHTLPVTTTGDAAPYVGYRTTWSIADHWLGSEGHGSLSTIKRSLGFGRHGPAHVLEAIEEGFQRYCDEHEKPPSIAGDATPYMGYETSWRAVGDWLHKHGHGSFFEFKKAQGFGRHGRAHSFEAIEKGVRKFYEKHEKFPPSSKGVATPYVGYKTTWAAVSHWLRSRGHPSTVQIGKKLGLKRIPKKRRVSGKR